MNRPEVLLIFRIGLEECTAMLKGIAHFERTNNVWTAYHDDEAISETDVKWVRDRNWKGVISRHTTPKLANICRELKIPLVDMNDVDPYPGIPKIRPDNARIGQLGAEHLIGRGYRHFGFAGFSNMGWSRERRDSFTETVRLAGHDCSLFDVPYPGGSTPFWNEKQIEKLSAWLKKLPKFSAVMACNDLRAQQLITAAATSGILVPEDIAILGANNETFRCEMTIPALSSVAPNAFQSGFRAAGLLNDMLLGRKVESYDQRVEPLGVVARLSTNALAIDDDKIADAVNFIRKMACNGLTVDQVAENSHISRSLLEKKFRRYIGRSPQAEIRRVQVSRITELLIETDYPLKRIAELTGFDYTEYMSVLFKRMTGLPPGEYREKMRDKAIVRSTVDVSHADNITA
jgi:LacI family transcriptional regulator